MSAHEPFRNPNPLVYGESVGMREAFDRVAASIKDSYSTEEKPITDDEAIEAARNVIGYVELIIKITDRNIKEGKISPEEIKAAEKRAEAKGYYIKDGELKWKKPKNIPAPETAS